VIRHNSCKQGDYTQVPPSRRLIHSPEMENTSRKTQQSEYKLSMVVNRVGVGTAVFALK
jgi:hypothetical protein